MLSTRPESPSRCQYWGQTHLPLTNRRYGGVLQRFVRPTIAVSETFGAAHSEYPVPLGDSLTSVQVRHTSKPQ